MGNTSDKVRKRLSRIPELPGIYKMLDSNGKIIYIGKSISLRKRVRSYFTGEHKWKKIERMVALIDDIEYEVSDTHLEARLEECRLIKEIKPIFNSQFKNDRRYIYLQVNDYNIYNSLSIVYEREGNCHGPFRSSSFIRDLISSLKNLYPITKVNGAYDFNYKLMPMSMDLNTFNENKDCLNEIFTNDKAMILFINRLEEKMKELSLLLKFETASYYKSLISNLNYIRNIIFRYKDLLSKNILLKIPIEDGYKLFLVRRGQIILKEKYRQLEKRDIEDFIKKSKELKSLNINYLDEKKSMDFTNIIYSEIKSLGEEMVIYLD